MSIEVPLQFDRHGRTAESDRASHVRDLVEAVLFTTPGERVNRPTFGCGLPALLFLGNDPAIETTAEMTVRAALQAWLGDVVAVERIVVEVHESRLTLEVAYAIRATNERRVDTFERAVP